jgi:hypothetical protein
MAISKHLVHVFYYYKDLSTTESLQVLNTLKGTYNLGPLFIYFGIYRKNHFKNQLINFNAKRLEKELINTIKSKDEENQGLRKEIIWEFWKILKEAPQEFNTIRPYIDLFLQERNERDVYNFIIHIIEDWIARETKINTDWFKQVLSHMSEILKKDKETFWLVSAKDILREIANKDRIAYKEILEKLISLTDKGLYLGNIEELKNI